MHDREALSFWSLTSRLYFIFDSGWRGVGRLVTDLSSELIAPFPEPVTHALVTSPLDYSNALCVLLSSKTSQKLQVTQNSARHTVLHGPRFTHVTLLLHELHWFPVSFKVLVLTFKVLCGIGPGYLRGPLSLRISTCPTRLDSMDMLLVPFFKHCNFGSIRFLWQLLAYETLFPLKSSKEVPSYPPSKKILKIWLFPQLLG